MPANNIKPSNRWVLVTTYRGGSTHTIYLEGRYTSPADMHSAITAVNSLIASSKHIFKLPKYAYHPKADGHLQSKLKEKTS